MQIASTIQLSDPSCSSGHERVGSCHSFPLPCSFRMFCSGAVDDVDAARPFDVIPSVSRMTLVVRALGMLIVRANQHGFKYLCGFDRVALEAHDHAIPRRHIAHSNVIGRTRLRTRRQTDLEPANGRSVTNQVEDGTTDRQRGEQEATITSGRAHNRMAVWSARSLCVTDQWRNHVQAFWFFFDFVRNSESICRLGLIEPSWTGCLRRARTLARASASRATNC